MLPLWMVSYGLVCVRSLALRSSTLCFLVVPPQWRKARDLTRKQALHKGKGRTPKEGHTFGIETIPIYNISYILPTLIWGWISLVNKIMIACSGASRLNLLRDEEHSTKIDCQAFFLRATVNLNPAYSTTVYSTACMPYASMHLKCCSSKLHVHPVYSTIRLLRNTLLLVGVRV